MFKNGEFKNTTHRPRDVFVGLEPQGGEPHDGESTERSEEVESRFDLQAVIPGLWCPGENDAFRVAALRVIRVWPIDAVDERARYKPFKYIYNRGLTIFAILTGFVEVKTLRDREPRVPVFILHLEIVQEEVFALTVGTTTECICVFNAEVGAVTVAVVAIVGERLTPPDRVRRDDDHFGFDDLVLSFDSLGRGLGVVGLGLGDLGGGGVDTIGAGSDLTFDLVGLGLGHVGRGEGVGL